MKRPIVDLAIGSAKRLRNALGAEVARLRSGYEERGQIAAALARLESQHRGVVVDDDALLTSRACCAVDFDRPSFRAWCTTLEQPHQLHRKLWEFWFVARALDERGLLRGGKRGVGFGVGQEPLPAAFAARGCDVVATDQADAVGTGWAHSGQWSARVEDLRRDGICAPELLRQRVTFRAMDMNHIDDDVGPADFVWSACALEHLGSIEHGLRFIRRSLDVLRPGGVAVHTTELNLSSPTKTLAHGATVLFRRSDLAGLITSLRAEGHTVADVDERAPAGIADGFVDVPPYRAEPHLRLRLSRYTTTSVGLIIEERT